MRVTFILPGRGCSGGVRCTVIAANQLLARGHKARILYRRIPIAPKIVVREAVNKLLYNGRYDWLGTFGGEISGYRDISKCEFDPDEIIVGVGMWCSAEMRRINAVSNPKLQYIHGLTPWMPEVMTEALSLPIPKVAVSSNVLQEVKLRGPGAVLAVIPNGIDQAEYYPSVDEHSRDGCGTIYSPHPAKDPETILNVLDRLREELPDVPHYIFGTARRPERIRKADYVRYPSVDQARRLYSRSKVWILASRSEGFPGPVLEAMACGCAVVATDCGGIRDIISDGENGLLAETGNTEEIVAKVKLLLNDSKLRQKLVRNSQETVKRFNWESSVDKLENVLKSINNNKVKVCLLGASFDTNNLGVSALTASMVRCVNQQWPWADIVLLDYGQSNPPVAGHDVKTAAGIIPIQLLNMRFSKMMLRGNHIARLLLTALLLRLLPSNHAKTRIIRRSPHLQAIAKADVVAGISAGDSFSDLYGMKRLMYVTLPLLLVVCLDKPLVLLPQTYGPFESLLSKKISRFLLSRATTVYSRDKASIDYVQKLLGKTQPNGTLLFCPDLAFALEPYRPKVIDVGPLLSVKTPESVTVGLNISGLLYSGGYTRNNMFGLKADYKQVLHSIVDELMQNEQVLLLLVPHVVGPDQNVESDRAACLRVYEKTIEKYPNRVFLARGTYDQSEIKYVIGLCDFFIGSRMHACIAALSQSIPAVGLAYSRKFQGVFETVGAGHLAVDMRHAETEEILTTISDAFERREITARHLKAVIPQVQKQVLNIFEGIL